MEELHNQTVNRTKPNNNSQKKNRGNHHARPRIEHQQYRRNTEKEK
jgi:hypothetical protein